MFWIILAVALTAITVIVLIQTNRYTQRVTHELHVLRYLIESADTNRPPQSGSDTSRAPPADPEVIRQKEHLRLLKGGAVIAALVGALRMLRENAKHHQMEAAAAALVSAAAVTVLTTYPAWQDDIDSDGGRAEVPTTASAPATPGPATSPSPTASPTPTPTQSPPPTRNPHAMAMPQDTQPSPSPSPTASGPEGAGRPLPPAAAPGLSRRPTAPPQPTQAQPHPTRPPGPQTPKACASTSHLPPCST